MGIYLNPGNEKFQEAVNSAIYVDKTELIRYTNSVMHTTQKYICVCRPRRFGKSMAANMLAAYYGRGCDSKELLREFKIAQDESFAKHLNRYDVIFLNMQEFLSRSKDMQGMLERIKKSVLWDLLKEYSDYRYFDDTDLIRTMQDIYQNTKRPFVVIVDEWDCIFREYKRVYIDMNFEGIKDDVLGMMAGERAAINTSAFTNDMTTFESKDDVLTLLVHLGYLGYDFDSKCVFIPNNEIRNEYVNAVSASDWGEVSKALRNSAKTLEGILRNRPSQVVEGIEQAHFETSHIQYNDENALSYTISLALYAARNFYTVYRELPTGKGFADMVYVPRKKFPDKPALVVELKWDKSAEDAIAQIKKKEYCKSLEEYSGNLLLVGINYDKDTREHECVIEEWKVEN